MIIHNLAQPGFQVSSPPPTLICMYTGTHLQRPKCNVNHVHGWHCHALWDVHAVFLMGFSPRRVHYGFSVTKEMSVKRSWGGRVMPNFISTVAGQSLKSRSFKARLHAASWCLPLGLSAHTAVPISVLSAHTAVPVSVLSAATTPASALLSCSRAADMPPCRPEHWAGLFT